MRNAEQIYHHRRSLQHWRAVVLEQSCTYHLRSCVHARYLPSHPLGPQITLAYYRLTPECRVPSQQVRRADVSACCSWYQVGTRGRLRGPWNKSGAGSDVANEFRLSSTHGILKGSTFQTNCSHICATQNGAAAPICNLTAHHLWVLYSVRNLKGS